MKAITRTLRRITNDIGNGRHLENYAMFFITLGFAFIGVGDDIVSTRILLVVVLAGVSLLIFKNTIPIEIPPDLDQVLQDRDSFAPLRETIQNRRQLWIYAPSGINVLNSVSKDIRSSILSRQNGEVRVVIQDNSESNYLNLLTSRLDDSIEVRLHDLPDAINKVSHILAQMQAWDTPGTLEYRYFAYSPGFSLVAVDPESRDGMIIVEFHGVINEQIGDRMHIVITPDTSRYWYDYWLKQFLHIWEHSRLPDKTDG